jgi:glycosyltransferase involved in cell wall biosynthesis
MAPPLVSIIIPCYNGERFVGEAIESSLRQTHSRKEVIVIDDGSTDRSLSLIRSFGDRIRWETGPNRGAGAARNRGMELADGELIQFLDADDLLHPTKIEAQLFHCGPDRSRITFCNWRCEVLGGASGSLTRRVSTSRDPVIFALQSVVSTPAPLYPRELLHAIGGWDASLPCAQDYDLNLRLACSGGRFIDFPEVLITLRRVPSGLASNHHRILEQFVKICWSAYDQLERDRQLTDERAAAFAGMMASHARTYLVYGIDEQAALRFADAARMHPSGGLTQAYSGWTRGLRRVLGPVRTEQMVQVKRRLFRQRPAGTA